MPAMLFYSELLGSILSYLALLELFSFQCWPVLSDWNWESWQPRLGLVSVTLSVSVSASRPSFRSVQTVWMPGAVRHVFPTVFAGPAKQLVADYRNSPSQWPEVIGGDGACMDYECGSDGRDIAFWTQSRLPSCAEISGWCIRAWSRGKAFGAPSFDALVYLCFERSRCTRTLESLNFVGNAYICWTL